MKKVTDTSRPIIGKSRPIQDLLKLIERVAHAKTNLLVIGESGTGKELVARMIHDSGPLRDKPFVPVNCGAIAENLIESEMFGHKRGSFTGAVNDKMGLFEVAHGGTLFLDEVGELPLSMQVKLLRAIQERLIKKVGGTEDIRIDVRIIAATNRDLEAAVAQGTFREDLYYRLNVILIKTPPLRDRPGDVRILAEHFLKKCASKYNHCPDAFEPDAIAALEAYSWPGNVRELENVIERAVALQGSGDIRLASLTSPVQAAAPSSEQPQGEVESASLGFLGPDLSRGPVSLVEAVSQFERVYIQTALKKSNGSVQGAAALLKMSVRALRDKMKSLRM